MGGVLATCCCCCMAPTLAFFSSIRASNQDLDDYEHGRHLCNLAATPCNSINETGGGS